MNQKVIDQQKRISAAIDLSFGVLEAIARHSDTFKREKVRIDGMKDFTKEAREKMINRAADTYHDDVSRSIVALNGQAETIADAMGELENILDVGEELQNALNVAKFASKLPFDTRSKLVEQFRGQPQQIAIIAAALEESGIGAETYTKALTFTSKGALESMKSGIARVAAAKPGETVEAWRFSRDLEKLGKTVGAENHRPASSIQGLDGGLEQAIREACGL